MEDPVGKKVKFSFLREKMVGKCIERRTINEKVKFICTDGRYKYPADEGSVKII